MTAAPMAACLLQWLGGSARKPGLHFQALLAKPKRLLSDIERMSIEVSVRPAELRCRPRHTSNP